MVLWWLRTYNFIPAEVVALLLILHFIGDFLLQNNWMALNKSKDWTALWCHVSAYTVGFLIFFGLTFGVITWVTHFLTDALTSRVTSKLWFIPIEPLESVLVRDGQMTVFQYVANVEERKRHWFFVAIGADQLIHFLTLLVTYLVLGMYF